jgi:hypothetical protein
LADAANKIATDMMVSAEYHAMPRRWAFGLKESDFVDAAGNQMSPWSMIAGHLWANEDAGRQGRAVPRVGPGELPQHDPVLAQLASQT